MVTRGALWSLSRSVRSEVTLMRSRDRDLELAGKAHEASGGPRSLLAPWSDRALVDIGVHTIDPESPSTAKLETVELVGVLVSALGRSPR